MTDALCHCILCSINQNQSNPCTKLDSQADSLAVGHNSLIIKDTGHKARFNGFTKSLGTKTVPIVYAAVLYESKYGGNSAILMNYNALYFAKMVNNLILPFLMRLAGLGVNETPEFMVPNPSLEHHSIFCSWTNKRMSLSLTNIVSYIPT